jgi:hypothetical protein
MGQAGEKGNLKFKKKFVYVFPTNSTVDILSNIFKLHLCENFTSFGDDDHRKDLDRDGSGSVKNSET